MTDKEAEEQVLSEIFEKASARIEELENEVKVAKEYALAERQSLRHENAKLRDEIRELCDSTLFIQAFPSTRIALLKLLEP